MRHDLTPLHGNIRSSDPICFSVWGNVPAQCPNENTGITPSPLAQRCQTVAPGRDHICVRSRELAAHAMNVHVADSRRR